MSLDNQPREPLISIVTAVYNRAKTIIEAIESVREQSYPHVEHVVIDGASTDGTQALLAGLDAPGFTFLSEPDRGIYDALNKGIRLASGDVVGLMHSDDFFATPAALKRVADAFSDPGVDLVYGDLEYVSANDPSRVVRYWRAGAFSTQKLRRGWMPPHPTVYVRREILDNFGLYDTSYRIAADYDFLLRYLSQEITVRYVPEVLVRMRIGGASNSSLRQLFRKSMEDRRALRENGVGGTVTLLLKNFSKLSQFISRSQPRPDECHE